MNKTNVTILAGILILFAIGVLICFIYGQTTNPSKEQDSSTQEETFSEVTTEEESTTTEESVVESEESEAPEEPHKLEPISRSYEIIDSENIKELEIELSYCESQYSLTIAAIESITMLSYDTDLLAVLQEDCDNYSSYINYYKERIQELKYNAQYAKYPAATFIWYYMKYQGWSDYVCAGIMGNIMQEVGGRTLNINYMHSNAYYGICCWKKVYHPGVVDKDLEGQCEYLVATVANALNYGGYLYQDGYTFEDFLAAESVEEAAAAFMIVYERPGHTDPTKRVQNGVKAYEYFVGTTE